MPSSRALIASLLLCATAVSQGLPLEVHNPTSQSVTDEPVTFGIPIPLINGTVITDLEALSLAVCDPNGVPVPHQYRTLSRWFGPRHDQTKSLKWVQLTFLADVPPNSTAVYRLSGGWRPAGQLQIQSQTDRFVISTQPGTSFSIHKQTTSLFEEVTIANQAVVSAPGGGIRMTSFTGANVTATPTSTYIQEGGSVRAVVVQKGLLSNGLRYTIRYHFHSGRDDVAVDFRLENHGVYGQFQGAPSAHKYFDHCHLWLPVEGAGAEVTTPNGVHSLSSGSFEVNQDFQWGANTTNVLGSFFYEERENSSVLASGDRHSGAIDLSGTNGGLTVAVDRFWENFPKAYRVSGDELEIGLWPEWGNGPEYRGQYATLNSSTPIDPLALDNYRFEGGRWKTHRVMFSFHDGVHSPTRVGEIAELTNRPIMGRAPGWWTAQTAATGTLFATKRTWNEVGLDRMERQFRMIWDDTAADTQGSGLGQIGFRRFRQRGGTYGGRQFYGWANYGDIVWGGGYGGLHYDWPLNVMLNWVRGGSYEFFDIARDMCLHRRDYDQNHSKDPAEVWRGCQFYEKGWWHGNYMAGYTSHNWVHGVLLHYALTGDEASYEAALESQDYLLRISPGNWSGYWGSRILGWSVSNLVDLYNYLGETAALVEAKAGVDNFLQLEQVYGGNGYVSNPGGNDQAIPWMHAICFKAFAKYTYAANDMTYLPMMRRMRDWLRTCVHLTTSTAQAQMGMPYITNVYHPANGTTPEWHEGSNAHHGLYIGETMAISTMIWRDVQDLDCAWLLYEFQARFHQKGPGQSCDFDDPTDYSVVAMRMMQYPNSESKIMGGMLGTLPTYMGMRAWLNGTLYQQN